VVVVVVVMMMILGSPTLDFLQYKAVTHVYHQIRYDNLDGGSEIARYTEK
jgi:hypothetical protein